jgi:uncharacterized protein HemX
MLARFALSSPTPASEGEFFMATVHIDNNSNPPVEREIVREVPVQDNSGSTALIVLALLVIAILAAGAYFYYVQTPATTDTHSTVSQFTQGVDNAGQAVGDTTSKVTRSTTTTNSNP